MIIVKSCIDIYVHNCLKLFSIGQKACSNSKTYFQIMKFKNFSVMVPFEQGLGCDVTVFCRNKMANIEEATCFLVKFYKILSLLV